MSNARVLLVEDDATLAELLIWYFERESFHVRWTTTGEEALLIAAESPIDLVVLDWNLGALSGIEVCRRLRRTVSTANLPIMMLTGRADEADKLRGLDTGADDYVTKPFSPRELIARLRALLRRIRPALAGEALRFADLELDAASATVRRGGTLLKVGPTEFRLLRQFIEHPRRVFSRERLLDLVWPDNEEVSLRTVDVHIMRLRRALSLPGRPNLIRTVRSAGYALDAET